MKKQLLTWILVSLFTVGTAIPVVANAIHDRDEGSYDFVCSLVQVC